jgi:uncharacterized protein
MRPLLVEDIPQEGLEVSVEESPDTLDLRNDEFVSYIGKVAILLRFDKLGEKVRVKGKTNFNARLSCSRCLEYFSKRIDTAFNIVYEPQNLMTVKKEKVLDKAAADVYYYGKDRMLKVGEVVREIVMLNLPIKPLCRTGCAGLCPNCGKNLNQGSCSCRQKGLDHRFSKLKSNV